MSQIIMEPLHNTMSDFLCTYYMRSLLLVPPFFFSVLPTIRARQSDVNATADISSSALLACDADGFPEPTVTWT